ncbi:MAG: hypothetical protein DRQ65_08935, partial [Gammaproteobacteria bacterium]
MTGGNSPGDGGGIFADVSGTDITLSNVQLDNNNAGDSGGAIYLFEGTLNASDITFSNNTAVEEGGAIYARLSDVVVVNGLFESNTGGNGGAVMLTGGTGSVTTSVFSLNSATGSDGPAMGGAIYNAADLSITDTTIDQSVSEIGGGIFNSNFGGVLKVVRSTLSNNQANNLGEVAGGGVGGGGTITILNSTISGNTAVRGHGGGIGMTGGTARLNNVTVAHNAALDGLRGGMCAASGEPGAVISLSNSIRWRNSVPGGTGSACVAIISLGYNTCEFGACTHPTDINLADPLIEPLGDKGGLTQTHSLQALSPAIDAGNTRLNFQTFDATTIGDWQLRGFADTDSGTLLLAAGNTTVGSAYLVDPIDVTVDFSARFQFRMTPADGTQTDAADGITFSIVADPTVLGDTGNALGIAAYPPPEVGGPEFGVVEGVSVEFDTWSDDGLLDNNMDHVGIDLDGDVLGNIRAFVGPDGTFSNGSDWTAWIDYDATTGLLEVRTSDTPVKPISPTLSTILSIADYAGATAYIGFTGATGFEPISGEHRILNFAFTNQTSCETTDQRGVARPQSNACDIGAFEAEAIPLTLGPVNLIMDALDENLDNGFSYPGVVDVSIIDIPIEKLTGDAFSAPESAPLGSFPLGSFPIGSFDLRTSPLGSFPLGSFPLGSFPLGSFPLGSFPLGSFPLSSIPLLSVGGWTEILNTTELAGAPLQTVTLEQLLRISPQPASVASIELRDLKIDGSPLASLSLPGLSLGGTSVAELDAWARNADPGGAETVCDTLLAADSSLKGCTDEDTLLGLEMEGAPVSALSLASLPLGSFQVGSSPIGSFPLGSFPLGSFPLGSFPLGSFPLGSFPLGSFPLGSFSTSSAPLGSFPLGSFPLGSFPLGSFNLLAAPLGSFPLGSFPIGSFPLGSFEIDGKSFCQIYDER